MKGYSKPCLPVIWRSNKNKWITRSLFREWFTSYFCLAVKEYCQAKNVESKALLVLDNAPGHPPDLNDLCDAVRVALLPSNTSCLIQPMDQGVITTFKAAYLRSTFQQALDFIGSATDHTVKEFWHGYHVMNAFVNLSAAWDEVQGSTLNAAWRMHYPGVATESSGPTESILHLHQEIDGLAHQVGDGEIKEKDIVSA
uniref:DDE-1 domain-containing protein n=1 Tax=Trichuris muris TaxID=70415 RepID=A0A5S6QBR1_TRIMR